MQQHEPGLSFAAAWRRLKETKPWLFPPEFGARSLSASNDTTGPQGNPQIRKIQASIHAAAAALQRECGLSFEEAWKAIKARRPELFERLMREAEGGLEVQSPKRIWAVNDASYIMLRAEDADELERQVASGLWS